MDCQGLPLWGRWHCVSNDGEGENADLLQQPLFMREDRKKALSLVIGKKPLLIADYSDLVDSLNLKD